MPIWTTTPVEMTPRLRLTGWLVVELPDSTRHLVGWNSTEGEGRVSSRIESFDPATGQAVTKTGRVYQLVGFPGAGGDALYTWSAWCRINKVSTFTDVTADVWAEMQASATRVRAPRRAKKART